MFFVLSKLIWNLIAPSHVLLWLTIASAIALFAGYQRAGRNLVATAAIVFAAISVAPSYLLLARPVERDFSRPNPRPAHVDGILTLGGGRDRLRLSGTYELSRLYPDARVVYSGGSGEVFNNRPGLDAQDAKQFLVSQGLDPGRLTLEFHSRNTWENILFTQQMIKPKPDETWLLATSALQLPRAMEIAHRLGWRLVPWPTDWISEPELSSGFFSVPQNLDYFDETVREIVGRMAYRLSGKATPVPHRIGHL